MSARRAAKECITVSKCWHDAYRHGRCNASVPQRSHTVRPIISAVLGFILFVAPSTYAQDTAANDEPRTGAVQTSPDSAQQNPPAAAGEEGTKPTRGFLSSLGHNL